MPYTLDEKVVQEYTGLNMNEIENLSYFEYLLYLRDGYIYRYSQSENGREYLEKCWIMEQTEPDRKALREQFGKGDK